MDVVAFITGLVVGVVAVGLAIEIGMRKMTKTNPASRPTHKWSLAELKNPRIVAEYLGDMELPKDAKVVVNHIQNQERLQGVEAKTHTGIRGNYILGENRALILAGPVKENELGIWTVEKSMLEKLNAYFEDSWAKAHEFDPNEQK
ncbi:MAG: hypothetical protein BV459_09060 [Thermoplasmata archaeon M11B2D]|nr:MAG: hypothetical protein BV459_09060 [Thermoplasmata archaeon M11B2D]